MPEYIQKISCMRTAADIAALGLKLVDKHHFDGKIPVKIDDGGVGGGVVDRLRQIKRAEPQKYDWMEVMRTAFCEARWPLCLWTDRRKGRPRRPVP